MVLQPPVNRNLFDAAEAKGLGLETLPATLEAVSYTHLDVYKRQ